MMGIVARIDQTYMSAPIDYAGIAQGLASGLPPGERANGFRLSGVLHRLNSIAEDVVAAVALFEHVTQVASQSNELRKSDRENSELRRRSFIADRWPFIAAKGAAMSVWHFGEAMRIAKEAIHLTPTVDLLTDWEPIKSATNAFTGYFTKPGDQIKNLRDGISHTTELSEHPDKHATRGSSGIPGIQVSGSLSVSDYLHGTTLFYTWKKHPRQLDISQDTVTKLCEVRDLMFSGLAGAARELGIRTIEAKTGLSVPRDQQRKIP